MKELLFIQPQKMHKGYGNHKINTFYEDEEKEAYSEALLVASSCMIKEWDMNIDALYQERKDLFNYYPSASFPLTIKLIDASTDLDVKVHPNNVDCSEVWYVMESENGHIVSGLQTYNHETLKQKAFEQQVESLYKKHPVKKDDCYCVSKGIVHGIGKGNFILEIAQKDDQSIPVNSQSIQEDETLLNHIVSKEISEHNQWRSLELEDGEIETMIRNEHFIIRYLDIDGEQMFNFADYFVVGIIIDGSGYINEEISVKKGECFIVPYDFGEMTFSGNIKIIFVNV